MENDSPALPHPSVSDCMAPNRTGSGDGRGEWGSLYLKYTEGGEPRGPPQRFDPMPAPPGDGSSIDGRNPSG